MARYPQRIRRSIVNNNDNDNQNDTSISIVIDNNAMETETSNIHDNGGNSKESGVATYTMIDNDAKNNIENHHAISNSTDTIDNRDMLTTTSEKPDLENVVQDENDENNFSGNKENSINNNSNNKYKTLNDDTKAKLKQGGHNKQKKQIIHSDDNNNDHDDKDNDNDIVDNTDETMLSKEDISKIRKVLFETIESYPSHDNSTNVDTHMDDENTLVKATSAFVQLFCSTQKYDTSSNTDSLGLGQQFFTPILATTTTTATTTNGIAKIQRKMISSVIQNHFDKIHARRFFSQMLNIIQDISVNQQYFLNSDNDVEFTNENTVSQNSSHEKHSTLILLFLQYSIECVHFYISGVKDRASNSSTGNHSKKQCHVLSNVYDVALCLHDDILTNLTNTEHSSLRTKIQNKIVSLCELWYQYNCPNREMLIQNILPILLQQVLYTQNTETSASTTTSNNIVTAGIKRLYQLRTAFDEIDFSDPDSEDFLSLLVRLVSLPICLNTLDGKRLLSYLLQCDVHLMQHMHNAIKVQIPNNRKSVLQSFGHIYHNSWKDAIVNQAEDDDDEDSDDNSTNKLNMSSEIESYIFQDLVYASIHLEDTTMIKSVLTVLQPFFDAKKDDNVQQLLFRLYSPILWRSLSARNSTVRLGAIKIFIELFPLHHPKLLSINQAITMGCDAIVILLKDADPRVRVATSETVASILVSYWDIIPTDFVRSFLNSLMDHASDTASSLVRSSALDAVTLILQNPASLPVLRPLVPKLGNLIHDRVEKVRAACVRMLVQIKKVPGIKYYHVVPVDHLTVRLAAEGKTNPTNSVATLLTGLMINSYIPQSTEGNKQLNRTLTFVKTQPAAAKVFYNNVKKFLSSVEIGKLAALLFRYLKKSTDSEKTDSTAKAAKRRRPEQKQSRHSSDEEIDNLQTALATVADVADIICILIKSYDFNEDNESDLLRNEISATNLISVLAYYDKQSRDSTTSERAKDYCYRVSSSILRLAAYLPVQTIAHVVPQVTLNIQSLGSVIRRESLESAVDDNEIDLASMGTMCAYIALLCVNGQIDNVAQAIASSIEAAFEVEHELLFASPTSDSRKRKTGKGSVKDTQDANALPSLPGIICLKLLTDILAAVDPSNFITRESLFKSTDAIYAIETALGRGTRHAEKILAADTTYANSVREEDVKFIVNVFECYGRFIFHKEGMRSGGEVFPEQAASLLQWTSVKVLPIVTASASSTDPFSSDPFTDLNISSIGVEQSFMGYSPVTTGPSRRRSNLSQTPGKRNDDKSICSTNQQRQSTAARVISEALAVSLLFSSCLLFSEWLAVGGTGGDTITKEAIIWWEIFKSKDDLVTDYEIELLPAFCRHAVQSYRATSDLSIIKSILVNCTIKDDCEKLMKQTMAAILNVTTSVHTNADDVQGVPDIVELVFGYTFDLFQKSNISLQDELQDSMSSLLGGKEANCCLLAFVEVLLEHAASFKHCVQYLIQKVTNAIEIHDSRAAVFHLNCLWLLATTTRISRRKIEIRHLLQINLLSTKQFNDAIDDGEISETEHGDKHIKIMTSLRDALVEIS